jgi:hypothetical protein
VSVVPPPVDLALGIAEIVDLADLRIVGFERSDLLQHLLVGVILGIEVSLSEFGSSAREKIAAADLEIDTELDQPSEIPIVGQQLEAAAVAEDDVESLTLQSVPETWIGMENAHMHRFRFGG